MRRLLLPLLALPLGSDLICQSPTSKPTVVAEAADKAPHRKGGYFGLTLSEEHHDGRVDLRIAVFPGCEAEKLGFKSGDIIRAVNGSKIEHGDDFIQKIYGTMKGYEAPEWKDRKEHFVTIERDGKSLDLEASLDQIDAHPAVGDKAPDFTLLDASGEEEVTLSDLMGDKPVFLVFGSYT
ncbi:MAG: hypothetical protein ACYTG5_21215 [Planctomycetota bacterium]|jgi:hypothetical protein